MTVPPGTGALEATQQQVLAQLQVGTGGGPVTIADGANVAQGTTTDIAWTSGAGTEIALLKKLVAQLATTLGVSGTVTANAGTNLNTSSLALEAGGNLASIKTDADSLVTNTTGLVKQADTFGTSTPLTAATTFSGIPTVSQLATNSYVVLANPGNQATFLAEVNVASAFVGTLTFYGLEADGVTLQTISSHLRGNQAQISTNTAISTAVALNQSWVGNCASFKSVYVVCTAFTSGTVAVQLGMSAAPYAVSITNTINASEANSSTIATNTGNTATNTANIPAKGQATMANSMPIVIASNQSNVPENLAQVGGASIALGQTTMANSMPVAIASNQGNIPVQLVDAAGTNKATIDAAGNQAVRGGFTEQASLSAGSLNADLVPSTDVSNYRFFSLQLTGTWTGTFSFQGSNDNSTWVAILGEFAGTSLSPAGVTSVNGIFCGFIKTRYFRIRMTSYTSGTANGVVELFALPGGISNSYAVVSQAAASTGTGTSSAYHTISAATNNAANVKNSAAQLYGYDISNTSASWRYVKLFNKASAPSPGTDTPYKTIGVPPGGRASMLGMTFPVKFSAGLGIAILGGIADNDNTSVGSLDVSVDLDYM